MSDSVGMGKCSGSFFQCMTSILDDGSTSLSMMAAGSSCGRGGSGEGIEGLSGCLVTSGLGAGEEAGFFTGGGVWSGWNVLAAGTSSFRLFVSCATGGRGFVSLCRASPALPFRLVALDAASLHAALESPNR